MLSKWVHPSKLYQLWHKSRVCQSTDFAKWDLELSKFHIGGSNPVFARIFDPSFKILDLPSDLMTWGVSHESLPLNMTKKKQKPWFRGKKTNFFERYHRGVWDSWASFMSRLTGPIQILVTFQLQTIYLTNILKPSQYYSYIPRNYLGYVGLHGYHHCKPSTVPFQGILKNQL